MNFISLLAGLALFLYGITLMGDSLNLVAGNKLELVLYAAVEEVCELANDLYDTHDLQKQPRDALFYERFEEYRKQYSI